MVPQESTDLLEDLKHDTGIILFKGQSLERIELPDSDCPVLLVNNFDLEMSTIRPHLKGRRVIQFVNRLATAVMEPSHYVELGISVAQSNSVEGWLENEARFRKLRKLYSACGVEFKYLPRCMLKYNDWFRRHKYGDHYVNKHPNTGLLAVCYLLECGVRELHLIGLDLYESDYLHRRPHQNSLKKQRKKMESTGMSAYLRHLVESHPGVEFHFTSNADFGKAIPSNIKVIR